MAVVYVDGILLKSQYLEMNTSLNKIVEVLYRQTSGPAALCRSFENENENIGSHTEKRY